MRLTLFDMDHTLIPADTGTLWAKFLFERNLVSEEQLARRAEFLLAYRNGSLVVEDAYRCDMELLQQVPLTIRQLLLAEFVAQQITPLISQEALAMVAKHRADGDYLVMITATLEEIAKPIARIFAFDAVIGGRGKLDELGNYTGEIELEPCMGRGKLVHLDDWLTKHAYQPSYYTFYSDSFHDLPLLEQVDAAIVVNPDPQLREYAINNNWPILSFYNYD